MSDLVQRLRDYRPANEWGDPVHHVIADEAADRIERLEAALEPFAELADRYDPEEGDDDHRCWVDEFTPTLGDLRRARALRRKP